MIYNARPGSNGGDGYSLIVLRSDKNIISLIPSQTSDIFTIDYKGDGTLTVTSSDTSVATVSLVSGTTYRVSAVAMSDAETTIKVKASVGAKTIPGNEVEIGVEYTVIHSTLNDNSWNLISTVSKLGTASSYWSVGDTKAVTLNGTVGSLNLSKVTLYAYILGFDHNSELEGNGISFGTFRTAQTGGSNVALVDSYYSSYRQHNDSRIFQMNHWGSSSTYSTNYGGWAACDMRYDILGSTDVAPNPYGSEKTINATGSNPSSTCTSNPKAKTLMAALPSDLRSVLKPIIKYTDNKGNNSNVEVNVTATIDYLPLLAEYEVQGSYSYYANQYERNKQAQYTYFINGNTSAKYKHNNTSTECSWWIRSSSKDSMMNFCDANQPYGTVHNSAACYSYGIAPIFLI